MTATLHKITAGDGYLYYIRQVAAHDGSTRHRSALADYYSARGETPGTWLGSGLAGLTVTYRGQEMDVSRVNEGDIVTEEQMHALFGLGMHPQAAAITGEIVTLEIGLGVQRRHAVSAAEKASRLGRPYRIYTGETAFRKQCAAAFAEYNIERGLGSRDHIPDEVRARIRTAVARGMFRYELGRDPLNQRELSGWVARNSRQQTTAVAAFGWCFSADKSVSVARALAPLPVAELLAEADRRAVDDAVHHIQTHATYTRVGRNGARQVEVDGLVATRFEHRDSRSGDPDFHTHIVVANRVRAADGQWRTLDGAMFYRVAVTASEIYNTRLEHHIEELLGWQFEQRPGTDPSKRPIRQLIGVDMALIEHFSKRHAAITACLGELTVEFQKQLGRDPTTREMYGLMQRATLETRQRKHAPRSLAEQRASWFAEAVELLGSPDAVSAVMARVMQPRRARRARIDRGWIARSADRVIDTIAAERSVWRRTHVRSEAERVIRGQVSPREWARVVDAVVAEALSPSRSVARGDPDLKAEPTLRAPPEVFRRADRSSVFTTAGSQLYTSVQTIATEAHLISMITDSRGRSVPRPIVDAAITAYNTHPDHRDRQLNEGQEAVVRAFATSGLGIQITDAPAGTGKTTAMMVLSSAWLASGGKVCGLAPTAKAAAELSEEISAPVNTVDKLLDVLDRHTPTLESVLNDSDAPPPSLPQWILDIDPCTLVIIDEHVQIPYTSRLRVLIYLLQRGATVRLLGDQWQLQSIDAGGAARDMIATAGADALTLTHVVRFADKAEAAASLAIREGDTAGLGYYLDRDRVHIGSPASVVDNGFHAWLADHTRGRDTIMLAATHTTVDELNTLARDYRLTGIDEPGPEVALGDGQHASVGDTIRTTLNNRRLVVGDNDYVRNGYQWTVTAVHTDASITAVRQLSHRRYGASVHLPADYVAAHTRLGYAATIDSVQGVTVDTSHTVLSGHESRYQLYVAITRGRAGNHLYLTTALDGAPEESFWTERAMLPRTATDILIAILSRDHTAVSAHTELRETLDPLRRIGPATDIYLEALAVASEHALGPEAMTRLDAAADNLLPTLTSGAGWPVLRRHLATIALSGHDPVTALREAITGRELTTADNIAAVLDWRLDTSGEHSAPAGPLPWLPGIPSRLAQHPELGPYLQARARIVADLARQLRVTAHGFTVSSAPVWARPLVGADPELLADLLVWRAANHVAVQDLRTAGPRRHTVVEHRHHHRLVLRAREAIGDANLTAVHWADAVKQLDERITDDPFWPVLAERLDTAHRAGIDITTLLTTAAARRPLPDDMPAAALWSRLDLDPGALSAHGGRDSRLRPAWTPDLDVVLGQDLADRIIADPAWPTVVAAVEHALSTTATNNPSTSDPRPWTALELLTVAGDLLLHARGSDSDRLRPDQLATALAWRIDALAHPTPAPAPPDLDEPPDVELYPEEDPIPDDVADFLAATPEHAMPDHPDHETGTGTGEPEPGHGDSGTGDQEQRRIAELAPRIQEVALRFAARDTDRAYELLARLPLTDTDRATIGRVVATLRENAFPIATARLRHAATLNPRLAPLIHACTPDQDPGLYRHQQSTRWEPPRDTQRRVDRAQIRDRDHRRRSADDALYRQNQVREVGHDGFVHAAAEDTHTYRDPEYGSGQGRHDLQLTPTLDLPCVSCSLELPVRDKTYHPGTRQLGQHDGLCTDCRDAGRPGIPEHDPANYLDHIAHRCAFIAATRPATEARAFLLRDWKRSPLSVQAAIKRWVVQHPFTDPSTASTPPQPPEQPVETTTPAPARLLTDAELAQQITDIVQRIALADELDAAAAAPAGDLPSRHHQNDYIAAIDAIHRARAAQTALETIQTRINEIARVTAAARAVRAAASRHDRAPHDQTISTLSAQKQTLIIERERARREEHDARRDAHLLAGPPHRWDSILAAPRTHPTRSEAPDNAAPPSSATDTFSFQQQLDLLQAEHTRRADYAGHEATPRPQQRPPDHDPGTSRDEPESVRTPNESDLSL